MIKSFLPSNIEFAGFTFYTYGIIISLALITYYLLLERDRYLRLKFHEFLIVAIGILLGGRTLHVFNEIEYYAQDWGKIFELSSGGVAFFGGLIGGMAGILLVSRIRHEQFIKILDRFAFYLPLVHAIGRWGNFFNNELYGLPSRMPWAVYIPESSRLNDYERFETFHPVFLYESILNLILFIVLLMLPRSLSNKKGTITALYFICYGVIRLVMMEFRIDRGYILSLESAIVLSFISIISGILILIYSYKKTATNKAI